MGAALALACEQPKTEPLGVPSASEPSPNASVLPAPLAPGPAKPPREAAHPGPDAAPVAAVPEPPRALREDEALPAEAELRAAPGIALSARWRWLEPAPPRSPEANNDALNKARDKTAFEWEIEASSLGRLRIAFGSRAFPFPRGTELRARDDRYGHALIWPGGSWYTPLPPGTLRAVLSEARVDVISLTDSPVALAGGGSLLGVPTRRQHVETSVGALDLDQALLPSAGSSGALLCRLILELVSVAPDSTACRPEWVPLRAELTWPSGARFELEVTKLVKRAELGGEGLATPPPSAALRRGELPGAPFVVLVDERELGELHARALPPPPKPEPNAPKMGLMFQNRSDGPRYLLVDGVPVVWLRADAEWLLSGLKPGRYSVQARDFFGAEATPTRLLELPARFQAGDELPH